MKATKIVYWITTGLTALMMAFSAFAYISKPEMKAAFEHLGFPGYFRIELAIAKLAGVIALVAPVPRRYKEWAYAGFAIVFISAFVAHTAAGDPMSARIAPLVFLGILAASYVSSRRLAAPARIIPGRAAV